MGALLMLISACGGKSSSDSLTPEEMVRQVLGGPYGACVENYLPETKARMDEADRLASENDIEGAKLLESEAVEIFKQEEAGYQSAVDAVNAQSTRYDETVARKNNIASHPGAANSNKWAQVQTQVDTHLSNAQLAIGYCDPYQAQEELDAANALLSEMEQLLGFGGQETTTAGSVYVVQKGDNLWNIASREYANPFMWPIIYWANQQKIKDPDLIFPKQEFNITQDSSADEKAEAERLAKTRGPWSLYDNK